MGQGIVGRLVLGIGQKRGNQRFSGFNVERKIGAQIRILQDLDGLFGFCPGIGQLQVVIVIPRSLNELCGFFDIFRRDF